MRCFACDTEVSAQSLDKKTDRYYCNPCFEPTNQVIVANLEAELERMFGPTEGYVDYYTYRELNDSEPLGMYEAGDDTD